jgi:glycosyltransferase involved in cell wall biosynthesis
MDSDFLVRVSCLTYNHAPYIEDAMNGFCMQETSFPYVCTIIDDASTDGEQEIIRKYLQEHFNLQDKTIVRNEETDDYVLTFARHKTNINCYFAVFFLKYNHYRKKSKAPYIQEWANTKYIALCEGDDYWIDPCKLQKQMIFMDAHPQHSLCFCAHKDLFPWGEMKDVYRYKGDKEVCPFDDIIQGGGAFMATNSMLYRSSMFVQYSIWAKNCPIGDLPLMLTLAHRGMVGYIADVMCVYRRSLVESWTNRMNSSFKSRNKHYHAIKKMWTQFDQYSDYQYHSSVRKKIKINRKEFYRYEVLTLLSKLKQVVLCTNKSQN